MVDASVRARTNAMETSYVPPTTGVTRLLPQRIAVIAQGDTTSAGYSTTKYQAESALQVGQKSGFRGPAYAIMRELRPANGDGVGSIPVDVIMLEDGGTAAAGDITPSGTASKTKTYYARIGGVKSKGFAIASGTIDVSTVCKDLGQACQAIPHLLGVIGWTYDTVAEDHTGNTGDGTLTELAASTTTCIPGDWVLECTAASENAGTFSLTDPDGTVVSTTVVASAAGAVFDEGGLTGKLTDGETDFAVGDTFTITVPALTVTVTAPWKGESGNDLEIELIDELGDLTFAITQPTGGATNPTVDAGLAQIGDEWNTFVINGLNVSDTTALDAYQTWGEGRWGELVHKPAVVVTGKTGGTVAATTSVTKDRTDDYVNSQVPAAGCPNLPAVIAARAVARIAKVANSEPEAGYQLQRLDTLEPGLDSEQWNHTQRDQILKAGSSTTELRNKKVVLSDVITMYAPDGDDLPAWRWVDDIVKLQNCIYNLDGVFDSEAWAGAVLIPDGQPVKSARARHPSDAKAAIAAMVDLPADQGIIADRDTTKASISASINSGNNRRLDWEVTAIISGAVGITAGKLKFSKYFGGASA